jgi:hypothetical protein
MMDHVRRPLQELARRRSRRRFILQNEHQMIGCLRPMLCFAGAASGRRRSRWRRRRTAARRPARPHPHGTPSSTRAPPLSIPPSKASWRCPEELEIETKMEIESSRRGGCRPQPRQRRLQGHHGGAQLLLAHCRDCTELQRKLGCRGTCLQATAHVHPECERQIPKRVTPKDNGSLSCRS